MNITEWCKQNMYHEYAAEAIEMMLRILDDWQASDAAKDKQITELKQEIEYLKQGFEEMGL